MSKDKKNKKQVEELVEEELQNNELNEDGLSDLEKKCAEYENGWKRALADYENLKREMNTRSEEARKVIKAKLAQDLLPVIDNFTQVIKFQPDFSNLPEEAQKKINPWLQGITYIDKQFSEALARMGVEAIEANGKFDPRFHEASSEKSDSEKDDNEILEVLIPGWKIGEMVLRPAKVVVNKKEE